MGTHDRDLPIEEVILDTDDDTIKESKKLFTKTRQEKVRQIYHPGIIEDNILQKITSCFSFTLSVTLPYYF